MVHLKELLCKESFIAALNFRTANLDQTALVWVGNSRIWIFVTFNIYIKNKQHEVISIEGDFIFFNYMGGQTVELL